jgi:hypothetical protein
MVPKLTRDQGDLDKVSGQWGRQTVMGVTCHIQVATSCPPHAAFSPVDLRKACEGVRTVTAHSRDGETEAGRWSRHLRESELKPTLI